MGRLALPFVLALLLAVGCGKKPQQTAPTADATQKTAEKPAPKPAPKTVKPAPPKPLPGPVKPAPKPTTSNLSRQLSDPSFALLPNSTLGLLAVRSVRRTLQLANRDQLVKTFAKEYAALGQETKDLGFHLLDPAGWQKVGIDLDRPAGVVLVKLVPEVLFGFFCGVGDPAAFSGFLARSMPKIKPTRIGTAQLWATDEVNVLLKGKSLLLVFAEDTKHQPKALELAKKLALAGSAKSLQQSPTWKSAGLRSSADGWGYLSFPAVVRSLDALLEHRADDFGNRERLIITMIKRKIASFKALGASATFKANRLDLTLQLGTGSNSIIHRLLARGKPLFGVNYLTRKPLLATKIQLNPAGIWGLVKEIAARVDPGGNAIKKLNTLLKQSIEKVMVPAVDGQMEFYISGDPTDLKKPKIGLHGFFKLNNSAVIQTLLAMAGQEVKQKSIAGTAFLTFPTLPGIPGYLGIVGNQLLFTTDIGVATALVKKSPPTSFVSSLTDPGLKSLFSGSDSGIAMLDARLLSWFVMVQAGVMQGKFFGGFAHGMRNQLKASGKATPENTKKLARLLTALKTIRNTNRQQENKEIVDTFKLIGHFSMRGNLGQVGAGGTLSWRFQGANFGAWLQTLLLHVRTMEQTRKARRKARREAREAVNLFIKGLVKN